MFALFQSAQVALLLRHEHVRQRISLHEDRNDEKEHQAADHSSKHTQQDAQAPPSLPVRIIKDRFCHCWIVNHHRKRLAEAGQSGIALEYPAELYQREGAITLSIPYHGKAHGTGAAELALFFADDHGRAGVAALLCLPPSSSRRRHLGLWRHRQELAGSRHFWRYR